MDELSALYKPKRTKYAEIECTLAPAPPKEAKPREQWLGKLKDMDALCHVVRAFDQRAIQFAFPTQTLHIAGGSASSVLAPNA